MEPSVGGDEAHEGVELGRLIALHRDDEGFGTLVVQRLPVEAHDLKGTPGRGLPGAGRMDGVGAVQAPVLADPADVAAGLVVDDVGLTALPGHRVDADGGEGEEVARDA